MRKNKTSHKAPAVLDKAHSPAGLKGDVTNEVVSQTASVIPWMIKLAVVGGITWYAYTRFTNRFIKMKEMKSYGVANITEAQAKARAISIASSKTMLSNDFDNVMKQLSGLNYNGFVRVYNVFGNQTGNYLSYFSGGYNLIQWLNNQFDDEQFELLGGLQNHVFF